MALHFDRTEYADRIETATRALAVRGLDGLLMFQQESITGLPATTRSASASSNVCIWAPTAGWRC